MSAPETSRLRRLERLFHAAAARAPAERAAFLAAAAPADPALAAEVAELLAAEANAPAVLDGARAEPDLVGAMVGPYRVQSFLAAGGMADVYRAVRRADDVDIAVALKVLRRGLDTAAVLARFRRERRTLAQLRHAHVVALADAGALPDGRPWLAMELVDGAPIDRWCEQHALAPAARLTLFAAVCGAVQHAHQRLVVHRDLKPSNVLVTAQGVPKLLDFGVARLLAPDQERDDECTGEQPAPLTPAWASPEQLRGETASTASDVYSLGLLLQRLVAPPAGSRLAADVALIVQRAAHEQPERRYASASELGDDALRARDALPLRAHPDRLGYRVRRFVARHRWAVLGGAVATLGLLAGAAGLWFGWRSAAREASLGWRAHAQAVEVTALLHDVLRRAPVDQLAPTLDAVAARLADYADAPETEGRMRLLLAALYEQLGDAGKARPHLERGVHLARTTRGFDRATVRDAEARLARLAPTAR